MIPEGGNEAETPAEEIVVILSLLANVLLEVRHKWKQTNKQPI